MNSSSNRYRWIVLQDGSLPLDPHGEISLGEHVCTATLVWPDGQSLNRDNSLVIDPCLSDSGWSTATERMASVDVAPQEIGFYHECHQHADHLLQIPNSGSSLRHLDQSWKRLGRNTSVFPRVTFPHCSGHAPDLTAVRFCDQSGEVWVASDAILNRQWLVAWEYYWPNMYSMPEIIETWRSIAKILATADTIIPGHGAPIQVNAELLQELCNRFPYAEYASQCPDVLSVLKDRLDECCDDGM